MNQVIVAADPLASTSVKNKLDLLAKFIDNSMDELLTLSIIGMGANTVKWTTHEPCLVARGSDSKLHTYFEFCEGKIHRHL